MSESEKPRQWPFRESAAQLRPPRDDEEDGGRPDVEPEPLAATALTPPTPALESAPVEQPAFVAPPVTPPDPAPATPPKFEVPPQHAGGELRIPDGYTVLEGSPAGGRRSVGIVVSRFNGELTNRLLESALGELERAGIAKDAITIMPVPGAFELPLAAMALGKTRRYACIVALGCVIRGETPHFDFVAGEAASGLQLAAIETGVPIAFGVLTTNTRAQAEARLDKGAEAVRTALEMAELFSRLRASVQAAVR